MIYQHEFGKVYPVYGNGLAKDLVYSPNQLGVPTLTEVGVPFKIAGSGKFWIFEPTVMNTNEIVLEEFKNPLLRENAYSVCIDGFYFSQMYINEQMGIVCETFFHGERTGNFKVPYHRVNKPPDLLNPWVIIRWNRNLQCEYYDSVTGRRCSSERRLKNLLRTHETVEGIFRTDILPHANPELTLLRCTHEYVDVPACKVEREMKWNIEVSKRILFAIQARERLVAVVGAYGIHTLLVLSEEETVILE